MTEGTDRVYAIPDRETGLVKLTLVLYTTIYRNQCEAQIHGTSFEVASDGLRYYIHGSLQGLNATLM